MEAINPELCFRCKGRNYCGLGHCPLMKKVSPKFEYKREFFGSTPPGVFVGKKGYPKVNVGLLSPVFTDSNAWIYDSPGYWASQEISKQDIIGFRTSLVNSSTKDPSIIEKFQEAALSVKPVDVEMSLKREPGRNIFFGDYSSPVSPFSEVSRFRVTENPRIPSKVDRTISDEMKAEEMVDYLYRHSYDNYYLEKLFSIGLLGIKKKLVPTRWTITALDDIIAKSLLKEVRDYPQIDECLRFEARHYGNHFTVFLLPDSWGFELFEIWNPQKYWWFGSGFSRDFEYFYGRKDYAKSTAGGYYASRLGIVEHLHRIKRQASAIVFRRVSPEYDVPLGVWVVREGVRKAMMSMERSSLEEVRNFFKNYSSKILEMHVSQKKLFSFFK